MFYSLRVKLNFDFSKIFYWFILKLKIFMLCFGAQECQTAPMTYINFGLK